MLLNVSLDIQSNIQSNIQSDNTNPTRVHVLNHGFLELVYAPTNGDLTVVNSARVSMGKQKDSLGADDVKLINYLVRERHDSPLRHVQITFRIRAPEFVMRQWYKHIVGTAYTPAREPDTAWNEISGRYVEYTDEFYTPDTFRQQSNSNKQGTTDEPVIDGDLARSVYETQTKSAYASYKELLSLGVGREIARTVLPLSFYTEVLWTASLQAVLNFISLRDHKNAQREIRVYAVAMKDLLANIVPHTMAAWEAFRT